MTIYADHAATTPVDPRVLDAMLPCYGELFYNPSSLYAGGRRARAALERTRDGLAAYLGCAPGEIYFTSGGTEGDNLAVLGAMEASGKKRFITSNIEHHAVLGAAEELERRGFEVVYLPCTPEGIVTPDSLREALTPDVGLVSVMWANNETGAIQPVAQLCAAAHEAGALFHTDAVQALGSQPIDLGAMGVDLLTLSAHKIYGPKGAGALYVRQGVTLHPMQHGGQQESPLRAGTENLAGIVGLGRAVELLGEERETGVAHQQMLGDRLRAGLATLEGVRFNTPANAVPGVLNLSCARVEAEPLMILMGAADISASMGAACNSKSVEPSHVLTAMKVPDDSIRGSLRLSLGKDNTPEEVDIIIREVGAILRRLRK